MNKVVETARVIHENGANHRDFYLCHFLLDVHFSDDEQIASESKLYLIDLHRIQLRRKTPERWAVKDIAGLYYSSKDIGLTKRDLLRFMRLYRGKPLREILETERGFWRKVESRGNRLYESEKRKAHEKATAEVARIAPADLDAHRNEVRGEQTPDVSQSTYQSSENKDAITIDRVVGK